jgi:phosphate transport system permease protein
VIHTSLFTTGNSLAARIANDIQFPVSTLQTSSLFYLALILLAIGVVTNVIARAIASRYDVHRAFV